MNQAAGAYARASHVTATSRQLEAQALMKAAGRLQAVQDDWQGQAGVLDDALTFNRKLWTLLATSATDEANPLPAATKDGVGQLATFVFNQTFDIMAEPEARKLGSLIRINRELAAGLKATPPA